MKMHIQEALTNLFASKLRSFLAILGILVGTASVVAMVSSGELATAQALQEFKALGTDLLAVSLFPDKQAKTNSHLELSQAMAMPATISGIQALSPYNTLYLPVSYNGHVIDGISVIGATQTLNDVIKIGIARGRSISFLDDYAYLCVIGNNLYQAIQDLGVVDPIGEQLQIGNFIFTIMGIAKPWPENSFFNNDINNAVLIPINTAGFLSKEAVISNLIMRLQSGVSIEKIQMQISQYLHKYAPGQRLFFRSAKEMIKSMTKQKRIFTLLLGLIGSISLVVGGIGIMNIMLVSVVERRREIGIRMAVGARQRDIQWLFLFEAITLSVLGGLLGILLGIVISYTIAWFAKWQFIWLFTPLLVGFIVSVATGIFFGFYPAHQASKLDPILALRTE